MVAYLEQDTPGSNWSSVHAVKTLKHLCQPEIDTSSEHADLLARLQGVLRVSKALCRVQGCKVDTKAAGMSSKPML